MNICFKNYYDCLDELSDLKENNSDLENEDVLEIQKTTKECFENLDQNETEWKLKDRFFSQMVEAEKEGLVKGGESAQISTSEGPKKIRLNECLETALTVDEFCKSFFSQKCASVILSNKEPIMSLVECLQNEGFDDRKGSMDLVLLKKGRDVHLVTLDNRRALAIHLAYGAKKEKFLGTIPVRIYGGDYAASESQMSRFVKNQVKETSSEDKFSFFQGLYHQNYARESEPMASKTITMGALALMRMNDSKISKKPTTLPYLRISLRGEIRLVWEFEKMAKAYGVKTLNYALYKD